jgi:hypothetical protein
MEKEAHRVYDKLLRRIVVPLIGNKTTYSNELEKAGVKMMGMKFKGVYPSDKIPPLNDLKPYAILNLDKSTESGSHWIAAAYHDGKIHIYDSFGRKASKIIPSIYRGNGGRPVINSDLDPEQDERETNCGARSLAWLLMFDRYGPKKAMLI